MSDTGDAAVGSDEDGEAPVDTPEEGVRERAQTLRQALAGEVHAPAEQDDHAASRDSSTDGEDED